MKVSKSPLKIPKNITTAQRCPFRGYFHPFGCVLNTNITSKHFVIKSQHLANFFSISVIFFSWHFYPNFLFSWPKQNLITFKDDRNFQVSQIQWKILDFNPASTTFYHDWPTVLQRIPFFKFKMEVTLGLPFPFLANEVFHSIFIKANEFLSYRTYFL